MSFSQKENSNIWKIVSTYRSKKNRNGKYVDKSKIYFSLITFVKVKFIT